MLAILGLVSVGLVLASVIDSDSGSSGGAGGSGEAETFTDEEDGIVDASFRADVEANFLDLIAEGELTQGEADEALDAITFTNGVQNIDTGDGDDSVLLASGNNNIQTGAGEDIVFAGSGDDEVSLGEDQDFYGSNARSVAVDDDIIDFPELGTLNGLSPEDTQAVLEGGDDRIFGGTGDDLISDSFGSNFVNGNQGDDIIITVDAATDEGTPDTVKGGFGFDTLIVDEGDTVETGRGFDTVTVDVFAGVEDGYDVVTISDFEKGKDVLELEGDAGLIRTPAPDAPGDVVENPITVTPLADGSGSLVSINGIPVVRVVGPDDLTVDDIVLRT
ncbi:MAG: hypothetical protein ABJL99_16080 [Aliishimia sp.]